MPNDFEFDFAVVGAGIAGCTLAARLAAHGRVLLLEREAQPGLHSTGRSAAMFMESYGPPQARALTRASRAEIGPEVLSPRGVLYVAWQGQEDLLAGQFAALQASGSAVQHIDASAALARVPALQPLGLVGAIVEADAMDIDVHALHQQALRRARALGATLWTDAELLVAQQSPGGWTLAVSGDRSVRTRVLVDAAGAWADTVAQRAGLAPLGLQPRRRSAFTFEAPGHDHRGWPAVVAVDEGWYFKPDAGQLLGSPANADPVPAHDVVAEEIDIATGIARIEERTTLVIRRPRRTWAGLRTFAPDGELVIGADPRAAGFFWLAGQGGYGIQSAAGAALLAEALLLGMPMPPALQIQGVQPERMSPARLI
ncbi:MAG: FAD-binding oxidoreductase [Rubrivivax sp.]|jgi:D-arginine dehydrogenase|nr:FAD-binding oxidoreductase [Betaproteobacteria bacterium]MBP6318353.1 FAD-binding oxidoreductase [Rubrivivax sp.]MBK7278144.1 FAD-binding oxidoreductase [Betaproteobacteria bacterium]MBK7456928.1 FAD-binding oxidoreductase [Betaproteobacteria bacterium]MBK7518340.1 FAD-binding oxidoreductase [Betaproteobacteria bacterium]